MTTWTKDNRKKPKGSRCGAKLRNKDAYCRAWAMPNGRCRLHGGKLIPAPKGNKRGVKHGLYAVGLLKGEKKLLSEIPLGTLNEEIMMLRIKLRRAWKAQNAWLEQKKLDPIPISSVELTESSMHDEKGKLHKDTKKKTIRRKEDFSKEIRALTKLISQLEIRRKELMGEEGRTARDLVDKFREFSDNAVDMLPNNAT